MKRKWNIPIDKAYCLTMFILLVLALFFRFCMVGYRFLPVVFVGLGALITCWKLLRMLKKHKPKEGKIVSIIFNSCVAVGLTVLTVIGCFVGRACFGDPNSSCEYMVVLGAGLHGSTPSRSLRERLNAAYAYLTAHPEVICIVSGGQGPGEDMTEAQCMYNELIAMGIDGSRIWMEDQSTSTQENLRFSLDIIESRTGARPQRIGVLSSEYHLFRAGLIAADEGVEAVGVPAKTTYPVLFVNYFLREIAGVCHYYVFGG